MQILWPQHDHDMQTQTTMACSPGTQAWSALRAAHVQ